MCPVLKMDQEYIIAVGPRSLVTATKLLVCPRQVFGQETGSRDSRMEHFGGVLHHVRR